jgi:hypothetical protein
MNAILLAAQPAVDAMRSKLEKKYPSAWYIHVSAMVGGPYGRVETDDEQIDYEFTKSGALRVSRRRSLTPTEISVRLQPKDRVIQLTGEGPHKGKYVVRQECDGWLTLTSDIAEAPIYRKWDADSIVGRLSFNAQYCYGRKFESIIVPVVSNN